MSITGPAGFTAAGVVSGIKEAGGLDLALVVGDEGTIGGGMFTVNQAAAAPVIVSRAHRDTGADIRAVVLNSGCANAATGEAGLAAARAMAESAAQGIGCAANQVMVASTGTIGPLLPVIRATAGIEHATQRLASGAIADRAAAMAIMTTDTVPKQAAATSDGVTVGGMAKGSGMVRPDLATMLVVLTTDAVVDSETLDRVLSDAVDVSFHALNIDGCPSTNDSVFLLTSGASGVELDRAQLTSLVVEVCQSLAFQLADDAEGASRVVTIRVTGAIDDTEARRAGRLVADSALVRSAFFGGDPNWGRIVGALGATNVTYQPDAVSVGFAGVTVAKDGVGVDFDESAILETLAVGNFTVELGIGSGPGHADVLTTDLTPEYVVFNGERS